MKILLRRASSLARACEREGKNLLTEFESEPDIRLSAYTYGDRSADIADRLRMASAKAMQQITDALELLRTQAQIRALIGRANAATVSPLLAERDAYVKAAVKLLGGIVSPSIGLIRLGGGHDAEHNAEDVIARVAGIRRRLQTVTAGTVSDSVRVAKLSPQDTADLQSRLADLQRRQIDLEEQIAQANLNNTIELADDIVAILHKHKIIA